MADAIGFETGQAVQVLLAVGLALLIGWEREESRAASRTYIIGGVRTFPIVGLAGYCAALLSPDSPIGASIGLAAVGALLVVSYTHKLKSGDHGATTEMAALVAYLVGALVARNHLWVATSVTVATVILLHAKAPLRQFALSLPPQEIATLVQFLLLAAVILPVLPNEEFTRFRLNPFNIWLIVVAVSGISYASYVLQRLLHRGQTALLTAMLGGTYSSTATTIVLAKRAKRSNNPRLYAGSILVASGVMYLRIAILITIFSPSLGWVLGTRLVALAAGAWLIGVLIATVRQGAPNDPEKLTEDDVRNPLEIWTALIFAGLFVGILVVTRLATEYFGNAGVYGLASLAGIVDVDPFILSLTQSTGVQGGTSVHVAAVAIIIAAAVNNAVKAVYSVIFGDRATGLLACALILILGLVSLLALIGI